MSDLSKKSPQDSREHKGLILKQIRESKSISLQTVHEATNIPMDALRAIEEGYTIRTLSSFYIRGFLKIYAQYLGVDVAKVIDDYQPEKLPEHINRKQYDSFEDRIDDVLSPDKKQLIVRGVVIIIALFVVIHISKFIMSRRARRASSVEVVEPAARSRKKSVVRQEPAASEGQPVTASTAVATISDSSSESVKAAQEKTKKVVLSVRAKKSSWLTVQVDGMTVFRSTLKRGVSETWSGNDTIEISGRNVNQLEFEHNGKMIGALGRSDRQVKRVVFTKSGFSVKE